mmetsp:Transcript_24994/g.61938  ORF Transcript_24994/g.61938 Transcript_24994/m.61938 type:complete len:297 (+) Transcript_24994:476-1366(+)
MEPHETSMQAKSRSASSGTKQTASATKKRSRCWRSQPGHRRSFTCEESVASRAVSKSNECICSKINSSTMHHSRLRNVGPAMMSSLRQPERKIGRQGRSPLFTRMQHLSIQMLGSQRLRSSNSARHACSTSHLAAGSSYQLCETNASIESSSAGLAMFVQRSERAELENTSLSRTAQETPRRRRRPSAMVTRGSALPIDQRRHARSRRHAVPTRREPGVHACACAGAEGKNDHRCPQEQQNNKPVEHVRGTPRRDDACVGGHKQRPGEASHRIVTSDRAPHRLDKLAGGDRPEPAQ